MKCQNCGCEMPDNSKFCGKCGCKLEQKAFCTKCGTELIPGMAFCAACGAKAGSASAPVQPVSEMPEKGADHSFSDEKPLVHITWVNCVFGDPGLSNNGNNIILEYYREYFSFTTKFSLNALLIGGWLGAAISSAKKKGDSSVKIPYSEIAEITFAKPKHDTAKRMNVTLKDGSQLHFVVAPMNKIASGTDHYNAEQLYQRLIELARPYMN